MSLSVIGVGLGRTGTLSLKTALEKLGYGPCYHMVEFFEQPGHYQYWQQAAESGTTDWQTLFEGYGASVDHPGTWHWRELYRQYPNAKYVLTIRNPEQWYESIHHTLFQARPGHRHKLVYLLKMVFSKIRRERLNCFKLVEKELWEGTFARKFKDKDFAISVFNAHNALVRETIPKEQLLELNIADGWAPLCDFLGVEAPDTPFPKSNQRHEFAHIMKRFY